MSNKINLRAHHLLCSVLFEGKGYSEEFTRNMTTVVEQLKAPGTTFTLQKTRDIICTDCPNLRADDSCKLDEHIPDLDGAVLEFFSLPANEELDSSNVFHNISENITPGFFNKCCGDCRWLKMGICSYDKYINSISNFY